MFYVITAKSIRKFLLWVLVLAILGWVVFALGSNRSQRDNFGTLADRWVIDFDRITIIPPPEEELDSSPPEEIEEPVLPTGSSEVEMSTSVVIGDPWYYDEEAGVHLGDTELDQEDSMTVSGGTLSRSASSSMVNVSRVDPLEQFAQFRLERDIGRSRQLEYLHGVLNREDYEPKQKAEADERLREILQVAELETNIENLLRASGISDAVVFISPTGANVVVNAALNREEAARIGGLVARMAQVKEEQVRITDNSGL